MNYRDRHRSVSFSLPKAEYEELAAIAANRGMSVGEFARNATRLRATDARSVDRTMAALEPAHGTA